MTRRNNADREREKAARRPVNGDGTMHTVMTTLLVAALLGLGGALWHHEGRVSRIEAENRQLLKDVTEIKMDIKTLLTEVKR